MKKKTLLLLTIWFMSHLQLQAQEEAFNYEEDKVPAYTLPDVLTTQKGKRVTTEAQWEAERRPEILAMFEEQMYGKVPEGEVEVDFQVIKEIPDALGGKAILKEVVATFSNEKGFQSMNILIFLPADASTLKPVPLFVGLNFYGNHTIHADPNISRSGSWARNNEDFGITHQQSSEATRGIRANRWAVEEIIGRGYGLATIYYGDIDPDYDDGFRNGIHPLFLREGQEKPAAEEWGSVAAWAWGLSRAMDYFATDPAIDNLKVAVMGHSRLGKASVWAGATDPRFALVISNNSGCGGAALSKRRFGETVNRINTSFPHWFNDNFLKYNDNESELPFDQHMLLALCAPRPVYVASAVEDEWADPRGEFLSAFHAGKVYELYGLKGLPDDDMPALDQPENSGSVGYHIRSGGHDVKPFDWQAYMDFADRHFR